MTLTADFSSNLIRDLGISPAGISTSRCRPIGSGSSPREHRTAAPRSVLRANLSGDEL